MSLSHKPGMSVHRWRNLMASMELYAKRGYNYVDVPWFVDRYISLATCPDRSRIMGVPSHGDLVGSAEQSFVSVERLLKPGKFMSLTPCFRDEPKTSDLSRYVFMKLELFCNDYCDAKSLLAMIEDARYVMGEVTEHGIELVETSEGFDLNINGIEVGSYGIREYQGYSYLYGTGLAEPRFSIASKGTK